jgi:hypothetical protein
VKDGSGNPPDFSSGDYNEQPDAVAQPNVSFIREVVQQGHAKKKKSATGIPAAD